MSGRLHAAGLYGSSRIGSITPLLASQAGKVKEVRPGKNEFTIIAEGEAVRLWAAIMDTCRAINPMRRIGLDDGAMIEIIRARLNSHRRRGLEDHLKVRELVKRRHYAYADYLIGGWDDAELARLSEMIYPDLRKRLIAQKVDLGKLLESPDHKPTYGEMIGLFCIDLCTIEPSDPLQAARLLLRYLNLGSPFSKEQIVPYRDMAMSHLCSLMQTTDEIERLKSSLLCWLDVEECFKALDLRKFQIRENEAYTHYKEALKELEASGAVKIIFKGLGDPSQLEDLEIVPITLLEEKTVDLLCKVVRNGGYSISGLAVALEALRCLASNAPSKGTSLVDELKSELCDVVASSPFDDIKSLLKEGKLAQDLHLLLQRKVIAELTDSGRMGFDNLNPVNGWFMGSFMTADVVDRLSEYVLYGVHSAEGMTLAIAMLTFLNQTADKDAYEAVCNVTQKFIKIVSSSRREDVMACWKNNEFWLKELEQEALERVKKSGSERKT
jgi:hypothetical protein